MSIDASLLLGAQSQGSQYAITIDGITYRVVQVDSQGRLVVAGAGGLPLLTTNYPGLMFSVGATNSFGGWTQVVANVGVGKTLYLVSFTFVPSGTGTIRWEFEMGVGAPGAETPVLRIPGVTQITTAAGVYPSNEYFPQLRLPDNARLAVRGRCNATANQFAFLMVGYA